MSSFQMTPQMGNYASMGAPYALAALNYNYGQTYSPDISAQVNKGTQGYRMVGDTAFNAGVASGNPYAMAGGAAIKGITFGLEQYKQAQNLTGMDANDYFQSQLSNNPYQYTSQRDLEEKENKFAIDKGKRTRNDILGSLAFAGVAAPAYMAIAGKKRRQEDRLAGEYQDLLRDEQFENQTRIQNAIGSGYDTAMAYGIDEAERKRRNPFGIPQAGSSYFGMLG